MATQGGIAEDLLVNLAEDIEKGEQMEALGRTLGFKAAAINRYIETNRIEGRVTCKGTRDMLFDWRQTVDPYDQHSKLKQALEEAKLIMLAQNYLKNTPNAAGIDSKKITESLNVLRCRQKLEKRYLNKLCKIQMKPWDQNDFAEFEDMHILVSMVKKDAHGKDTVKKEILRGSVAEIFSKKVNDKLPVRILISAAAGRGKTTAVAKMAYDWAHRVQGSGLEELPLLFVLRLRSAGQHTSLGEAIKSQLLSDDDITAEVLEKFIRENQDICHIIFDGLDEYAGITSGNNIVKIMLWDEYPECRVLVTTRPHLENFFNQGELPRVYTKIGIEGFSRESSRDYIDKFFALLSDLSKGQGLKVYLDGQPLIDELVVTPLFCLMVCHLWSEGLLTPDIATQTKLLDSVNLFLLQHANARSKSRVNITDKQLKTIISQLGKVALTGLLSDAKKLVFSPHDFRKVPTILERACELGILSKMTVSSALLPQSHETTFTTIEFYHKLAQEHSAGKHLAAETNKYLLGLNISKLDGVLHKINANIGDYENLLRFTAGTDNALCIKIMEAILTNESLDESERYRILLDCSSETTPGNEGNVSALVQRCVTSQTIVLKSPTVYTVVGLQNLPEHLKRQVGEVKFEGSTVTAEVTNGLWSCLGSFSRLHTLAISDSSLSFPPSLHELTSVTKLTAEKVTSQSYEGLLSSLPGLEEIDITIDDGERDISQITAGLRRTGGNELTRISLKAPLSLQSETEEVSRETMKGLGLLIREQTNDLHMLHMSGVKCRDVEDLVDLFLKCSIHFNTLENLYLGSGCGSLNYFCNAFQGSKLFNLEIKKCQLSAEITDRLWSCLRSFTTLHHLIISDSSLSFPPSPPELPSVTNLKVVRVTSQSYEGLLSSLPGLIVIDISIDDAERDISQVTACLRRTGGQQHTCMTLQGLPSQGKGSRCGSLIYFRYTNQRSKLEIKECQLSAEMTDILWSSLRSFSTRHRLIISDSSLSFPPSPPELPSVTSLIAERVTSQSYEALLSSLTGLEEIDITIDDAERDIPHITAGRIGGQQLTHISLQVPLSLPPEKKEVSRETMRGLGLLIRQHTKDLQWLYVSGVRCRDEEGLIDLVECCRHVKTMSQMGLRYCGTKEGGRLHSHLTDQHTPIGGFKVDVHHDDPRKWRRYFISHAV